jgi:hypothetical protein
MKQKTKFRYFEALTDIFIKAIDVRNDKLIRTIEREIDNIFFNQRKMNESQPVVYPVIFYEFVHRTIEEILSRDKYINKMLKKNFTDNSLLFGDIPGYHLSSETYYWVWKNILLYIEYKDDDAILNYWMKASDYYEYCLQAVIRKYDNSSSGMEIINEKEIKAREDERKRFVHVHYYLGGLLLNNQNYSTIRKMFHFTNSIPPKYILLPLSMDEIFHSYASIYDPYGRKSMNISFSFPFPRQIGLLADNVVSKWVVKYLALLFLRQYTLHAYYSFMSPMKLPTLPDNGRELKEWYNSIDFFSEMVLEIMANNDLMIITGYNIITDQWCETENKLAPSSFLKKLKEKLDSKYNTLSTDQKLDKEKIEQFTSATKQILENTLTQYSAINGKFQTDIDYNLWFVNGRSMLQDKDVLAEHPVTPGINYDSFLGGVLSDEIINSVSHTFALNKTRSYLLREDDIFDAIDQLNITNNYMIINFGIDINHIKEKYKIQKLSDSKYGNIKIVTVIGSNILRNRLFIINKIHLPIISTLDISENIKKKFNLDDVSSISDKFMIYTNVIDLNENPDELEKYKAEKSEEILKKSAALSIDFKLEIKWEKHLNLIEIIQYNEYAQEGVPIDLDKIKSI